MGRRSFTREFKVESVKLVRERGVSFRQAGRRFGDSRERFAQVGRGFKA